MGGEIPGKAVENSQHVRESGFMSVTYAMYLGTW